MYLQGKAKAETLKAAGGRLVKALDMVSQLLRIPHGSEGNLDGGEADTPLQRTQILQCQATKETYTGPLSMSHQVRPI